MSLKDLKIAVVGVGGVGGYLAGLLCHSFVNVTVVARGNRKIAIENNGMVLHSDHNGEIVSTPKNVVSSSSELGKQDVIFVCVKNYSLEQVCLELKDVVKDDTIIIPVMNGADTGDRVKGFLNRGIIIDSLIYIVSFSNSDYSITQQGKFANLRIGQLKNVNEKAIQLVSDVLSEANIDHKISKDIAADIWKKYMLNCAYNVLTAYYDNTIGQLRADEKKSKEYEALVKEAYSVAVSKGINLDHKYVVLTIDQFYHSLADDATSSLQRDFRAKSKSELETFSGYIVREAKRLGLDVPVSERMYQGLLAQEQSFG